MEQSWFRNSESLKLDPQHRARLLSEHGVEVAERNGVLELHTQGAGQWPMAILTFAFGVSLFGVGWLLPGQDIASAAARLALGCFGFSLLLTALYLPFNSLDIQVDRRRLRRVRHLFGVPLRSQEVSPDELQVLEIDQSAIAASAGGTRLHYALVGKGKFGQVELIEKIPDRALVEAIRRQILLAAGIKLSATQ